MAQPHRIIDDPPEGSVLNALRRDHAARERMKAWFSRPIPPLQPYQRVILDSIEKGARNVLFYPRRTPHISVFSGRWHADDLLTRLYARKQCTCCGQMYDKTNAEDVRKHEQEAH